MKYITDSDLTGFLKAEVKKSKKSRAFVCNYYGTGVVRDGQRLIPVFDSIDEILSWENPQDEFSDKALESVLSICSESSGLEKNEVVSRLKEAYVYGDFLNLLESSLSSIKHLLGVRIETTKRNSMMRNAENISIYDSVLVRMKNNNSKNNDDILYIVSSEDVANQVIDEIKSDEKAQNTDRLYFENLSKQFFK